MAGLSYDRDAFYDLLTTCVDTPYYPAYNEALVDWLNEQ